MTPTPESASLPTRSRALAAAALLLVWLLALPASAHGDSAQSRPDTVEDHDAESGVLIGAGSTGIAFGDRPRVNGVRITWRAGRTRLINGIDLALWEPVDEPRGTVNGLALGLLGPGADRLHGLAAGLGGVVASERIAGVAGGGLGVVSEGAADGLVLGGLGTVVEGPMRGVSVGGLGAVVEGRLVGVTFGGLGGVVEGQVTGVTLGGLGAVVEGDLHGIGGAGLGAVVDGSARGLLVSGVAAVADRDLHGVGVAGVATVVGGDLVGVGVGGGALVADRRLLGVGASAGAVVADEGISGLALAGYAVESRAVRGVAAAVGRTELEDLQGLGVAAWNQVKGRQTGLVIGLYNDAADLQGVQLGLLNRARNNSPPFELLPLLNAHFD